MFRSVNDMNNNENTERCEVLHWDGRLHNREDLLLRLKDSLNGETADAALARASYERWGNSGLVHLIGDWSVVIRDHANRTTVLASDFAGVRPLYYHLQPGRVLWSSSLRSLVDTTSISDLDEHYVFGFLRFTGCPNRTPYSGIYSVPPGHAVCVSSDRASVHRFWSLPTGDVIRYRSERKYEEQLRALFREAVAVRLQTASPVLAELSGGLDSSSVVCMANTLLQSGEAGPSCLTGVSFSWRDSLDEPFIREVESHCGIKTVRISTHEVPIISKAAVGSATPETFQPLRTAIATIAGEVGARTILTGQAGDLVMGNWFDDSLQVAQSLRGFRIGRACHEALAWSKLLRLPIYRVLWRALQATLPPALTPTAIYDVVDGSYVPRSIETSFASAFAQRMNVSGAGNFFSSDWKHAPPERRRYFRALSTMLELRMLQPSEPLQSFDYTHPFAHRPLIEFLMSIPADVVCRPGEPRRLMRSALSDLWPAKLKTRRSKAVFSAPWQEALRPLARELLKAEQLQVVERGFVERASFRSRLERLCSGLECNQYQLRQIILLELWLRHREAGGLSEQVFLAA
jgi:asparagine synthase (glutamine-hydrolysing)